MKFCAALMVWRLYALFRSLAADIVVYFFYDRKTKPADWNTII